MQRQSLDRRWKFEFISTSPIQDIQPGSTIVDLPHDFSIIQKRDPNTLSGSSNGFFPGGIGTYEKTLFVPNEWKGKKVMLEFEGAYMNTTVHINRELVARQSIRLHEFPLRSYPYLLYDQENTITVTVNNSALPNTRWYSGSGLYRHVWLMIGESVHITPWGIFATTPDVSPTVHGFT